VTRLALAALCALALLLVGCAHRLAPAIHVLNTTSAALTASHSAIVNVQDAESAQAEARCTTRECAEAAGAAVDVRYDPWWDAYHAGWLSWVAARSVVEASQAVDAAGGTYDAARVQAAVLAIAAAQERLREATEGLMQRRAAK
jgi:hypothetical protein